MNSTELFEKALVFIHSIGIETRFRTLEKEGFLPGLLIEEGRIIIDREQLLYPGDVLHEAAHIAVVPSNERKELTGAAIGQRKDAPAEEMMAIAWSYAACQHLAIDPHFVFHKEGYKSGGAAIVENFSQGRYIGVPLLQWLGMTQSEGENSYPCMIKWLRD